ncbi:DUF6544 family protein [Thioclava sp. FR2]|uniref:DUF6544 family protein n=1 Tax=Thioclava sp. FR2 TaxID=3445780 RepID=UPI003EBB2F00
MTATVVLFSFVGGIAVVLVALGVLRLLDLRLERQVWSGLLKQKDAYAQRFDPSLTKDFPEPAKRYLCYAISPGTLLLQTAIIEMTGQFGLGTAAKPNYAPMHARQILAGTSGFVWKMASGVISGSDGLGPIGSWTRFRVFGLLPVARTGFDENHKRSAFARAVAEAAFWAPASVLPGKGIMWEAAGPDTARLTVSRDGMVQQVDLTLATDGRPLSMVMPRWSNANPEKVWRIQPFGANFGAIGEFDGFRLPVEVDAGNFYGTADWFPFFRAQVTSIKHAP